MNFKFSVVSIGTEKSGSKGYINITSLHDNGTRTIYPTPHFNKKIKVNKKSLTVSGELSIEQIAFCRFQLIPAIVVNDINVKKYNKICIVGGGALGIVTYFEMLRKNLENMYLKTRREELKTFFGNSINWSKDNLSEYDCIIDCTGEGKIINNIIDVAKPFTTIILIGTPRKNYNINLLKIHRKNLRIYGGHELTDISEQLRQSLLNELSAWHISNNIDINRYVRIHNSTRFNLKKILKHKYIEPIHILKNNEVKTND